MEWESGSSLRPAERGGHKQEEQAQEEFYSRTLHRVQLVLLVCLWRECRTVNSSRKDS